MDDIEARWTFVRGGCRGELSDGSEGVYVVFAAGAGGLVESFVGGAVEGCGESSGESESDGGVEIDRQTVREREREIWNGLDWMR